MTKKWAVLLGLCMMPLFFLFAYFGEPGRGEAASICGASIGIAARLFWDLRTRSWYWITVVVIVLLHIPLILLVRWPFEQLSYVALLPAGFIDFLVAYWSIRLGKRAFQKDKARELQTSN
ncbi:MAG TPA: hypothetical protein VFO39_03215 [Candidatus Sulfotelmatobacter sp.]|nr:hypothetical protein [Candidatus Sulfotelmatobacter sp.]